MGESATGNDRFIDSDTPAAVCAGCGAEVPGRDWSQDAQDERLCVACALLEVSPDPPLPSETAPEHENAAQASVASTDSEATAIALPRVKSKSAGAVPLVAQVTCPHCWGQFSSHETLWISRHADLVGDEIAGPEAQSRFLPSRFTIEGQAIDARELACDTLACRHCHLPIPRAILETDPLFVSIVGAAGSGKSYFLTAMTWELRRRLAAEFSVSFADADMLCNRVLNAQEESLFLQSDSSKPVRLEKTDTAGQHLYDQIRLGQQIVSLPRPFLFALRPAAGHPNFNGVDDTGRVVCLYDNAGEHFNPGEDTPSAPVTHHLARSRLLMFLYDPLQDPRFRSLCRSLSPGLLEDEAAPTRRQETVLLEAASRVRRFAGLPESKKLTKPLLVILPKADVWGGLIDLDLTVEPILPRSVAGGALAGLDISRVQAVSARVRQMLLEIAPEFLAAAEGFSENVAYIPVSALGHAPEPQPGRPGLWVRPDQISPRWVTVPILYMFARWPHGLVRGMLNPVPT